MGSVYQNAIGLTIRFGALLAEKAKMMHTGRMHNQRLQRYRLLCVLFLSLALYSPFNATATGLTDAATTAETSSLYTIQPGDTLWHIAAAHGITLQELLALNKGLGDPTLLRPGQTIRVPGNGAGVDPSPAPASATYIVRPDDTLWDIAANYGLSIADLLAANPGVDPRRLAVGQQLKVPGIAQEALLATQSAADAAQPPAAETTPQAASDAGAAPAPGINSMALDLLNRINEKRLTGGRTALTWNNELAAAAQAHADDCARRNRGSHVGSDGARLAGRLQRAGYVPAWSGENWANAQSVEHALALWWNEPPGADPHVQNIMASRATEIGIGVAQGSWGIYFIADFGSQ